MSLLVKESKNFPPTFLKESRQRTFIKNRLFSLCVAGKYKKILSKPVGAARRLPPRIQNKTAKKFNHKK